MPRSPERIPIVSHVQAPFEGLVGRLAERGIELSPAQVHRLVEGPAGPEIQSERTSAPEDEPLKRQMEAFVAAVRDRSEPVVSGTDGLRALTLAHEILARMGDHK